jgi:hypothetical protein
LPPALSAKDLPGGRTQISNVCRISGIDRHAVLSRKDSKPEIISDSEDWLYWNGDLDNPNIGEDDCAADVDSNPEQGNGMEDVECPELRDISTAPNVPRLIRPT